MKKVGILTLYYKTYNYGAQLQAYALQKAVNNIGYDCEQISFKWSNPKTINAYENSSVGQKKFKEFSKSIPHSKWVYSSIDITQCLDDYDAFICGSDQIWGVNHSMPIHVLPQITLSFVPDEKIKFSYGASIGGKTLSPKIWDTISSSIEKLDAVSVREKSAKLFIASKTEKEISVVLDPVMLLKKDEWEKISIDPKEKEDYILVYDIGMNPVIMQLAKSMAEKHNCKLIRLGYLNGEEAGPREFLGLIKNAKYILTDSFHGTVFSVVYEKNFITFGVDKLKTDYSKNHRILEFLNLIGFKDRFSFDGVEVTIEKIETEIEYKEVSNKIENLRNKSINFLKENLSRKKALEYVITKEKCTGCSACISVCAYQAISYIKDSLGFPYPQIDGNKCTDCGKCREVCPVINPLENHNNNNNKDILAYSGKCKENEVRGISSSGGVFYVFAKAILRKNGVVFGARYNSDNLVIHSYVENEEELVSLCKSKYVQSSLGDCFVKAKNFLENKRKVLFAGTPCQIQGLKKFIGYDDENLYTIDLVCGGVTSPLLWEKYLSFQSQYGKIESISMRNKSLGFLTPEGFPNFSMELHYSDGSKKVIPRNEDMFLNSRFNFYRENCYNCDFKGAEHSSDLTIGDFCGINLIEENGDDGLGTSLVLIQSKKGGDLFNECKVDLLIKKYDLEIATRHNPMVYKSMAKTVFFDYFRNIINSSTIEQLYYETKLFAEQQDKERLIRDFEIEIIRNDLYLKINKFFNFGLQLENVPKIEGKIIIYGAGKLGKQLEPCSYKNFLCFIDQSIEKKLINGFPVYRLDDEALKKIIDSEKNVTIIVTPVWEYLDIKEQIQTLYKNSNVVSLEEVVEKIWI